MKCGVFSDSNPIQYINVLESHLLVMVAVRPKESKLNRNGNGRRMFIYAPLWPSPPPLTYRGEPANRTELQEERVSRFKGE